MADQPKSADQDEAELVAPETLESIPVPTQSRNADGPGSIESYAVARVLVEHLIAEEQLELVTPRSLPGILELTAQALDRVERTEDGMGILLDRWVDHNGVAEVYIGETDMLDMVNTLEEEDAPEDEDIPEEEE